MVKYDVNSILRKYTQQRLFYFILSHNWVVAYRFTNKCDRNKAYQYLSHPLLSALFFSSRGALCPSFTLPTLELTALIFSPFLLSFPFFLFSLSKRLHD